MFTRALSATLLATAACLLAGCAGTAASDDNVTIDTEAAQEVASDNGLTYIVGPAKDRADWNCITVEGTGGGVELSGCQSGETVELSTDELTVKYYPKSAPEKAESGFRELTERLYVKD